MRKRTVILGLISGLALAGCAGNWSTDYSEPLAPEVSRGWRVTDVVVRVPETLTVSNANSYAPNADIVWHGDVPGDRRRQVAAILDEGITRGAASLSGKRPVRFDVTLTQFHGVTPAAVARAPQAVHNISYEITVVDARTGETIAGPETIQADLEAYVGAGAIVAAQSGLTERSRIVTHLAQVTRGWLGIGPDPRREFSGLGR